VKRKMSPSKSEVEHFFVAVSATLTILQLFNSSLEMPASVLGSSLVMWLIYDKIPRLPNRRFSDANHQYINLQTDALGRQGIELKALGKKGKLTTRLFNDS